MKKILVFIRNTNMKVYILSILSSIIGILLNFYLAKVLQAEAYGEIQFLVSLATTISNFLLFGLSSFLIREAKNKENSHNLINKCFSLYFVISIFAIPIIFFILHNSSFKYDLDVVIIMVIILVSILIGVNTIISSYYQGSGKYHISVVFESLFPKLVLFMLAVVFTIIGRIMDFQALYLYFYAIIYGVVALIFIVKLFKKIDFKFSKAEIKSIIYFFGVTITYTLTQNLTKVLQGGLYDNKVALGIISVSLNIISIINIFTNVINNITKPIFARYNRENDKNKIIETYQFNTRVNSYIAIPFYIFFLTQSEKFLYIFGESYAIYPDILIILSLYSMISCLTGPNGSMLAMTGKEKWEMINGIVYLFVFLLFSYIFRTDTVYGLCFALLISDAIVNIMKYVEVWVLFKCTPLNIKTLISMLIVFIIDFILIFFLRFIENFVVWLITGMLIGAITIFINFMISLYRKEDFRNLLNLSI